MKTDDPNRTRPPPVPLPEPEPEPDPVDDDETGEPTVDDMVEAVLDGEAQQRLWLRTIIPLLKEAGRASDNHGVQVAYNLTLLAACDRVTRLLRSDLTGDPAP